MYKPAGVKKSCPHELDFPRTVVATDAASADDMAVAGDGARGGSFDLTAEESVVHSRDKFRISSGIHRNSLA